jgi:hypothetical protein
LRLVCSGKIENWKHDVPKKGGSTLHPEVRRIVLKLNSNLGPYSEEQLETVMKFVMRQFPKEKDEYKWYVPLPEALTRTKNILQISEDKANSMMSNSILQGEEIEKEFDVKSAKRARKVQSTSIPATRKVPERMKRPNYKFEENDEANILNPNYKLTDREIMMGQNPLRKAHSAMNGLMSTRLGPIEWT